jgi:hypothetical protein
LTFSDQGIDVSMSGKKIDPIEGCPADGPTLCAKNAEGARATLAKVLEGKVLEGKAGIDQETAALDALVENYRIDELGGRLDALDIGAKPPRFVIRTELSVPLGLLAELHSAVTSWTRQKSGEGVAPVVIIE